MEYGHKPRLAGSNIRWFYFHANIILNRPAIGHKPELLFFTSGFGVLILLSDIGRLLFLLGNIGQLLFLFLLGDI
jgi:hypothetical protein